MQYERHVATQDVWGARVERDQFAALVVLEIVYLTSASRVVFLSLVARPTLDPGHGGRSVHGSVKNV